MPKPFLSSDPTKPHLSADHPPGHEHDESLQVRQSPRAAEPPPAERVVLFADDFPDARELYGFYLAQRGYRVELACDGWETLEKALTVRPSIMLLDLSMPGIDGWTLIRILKQAPDTCAVPIVVLTAHAEAVERERAVAAGCDAYLIKPISPQEVDEALTAALARGGAFGSPAGGR